MLSLMAKNISRKCVRQFISIGGATMRENFIFLNTSQKIAKFGSTAANLVKKFDLDGVDIDDGSGNLLAGGNWLKNAGPNTVAYLKAIRSALNAIQKPNEPPYKLTWDEFPYSVNSNCDSPGGDYQRCFDPEIAKVVDEVTLMVYNLELSVSGHPF